MYACTPENVKGRGVLERNLVATLLRVGKWWKSEGEMILNIAHYKLRNVRARERRKRTESERFHMCATVHEERKKGAGVRGVRVDEGQKKRERVRIETVERCNNRITEPEEIV